MAFDVGELLEHALGRRVDLDRELRHPVPPSRTPFVPAHHTTSGQSGFDRSRRGG
jgi:hypothetical protein